MKKILSTLAITSLLGTLFFAAVPATYAKDDPAKLKIYYSESIGAGDKVLHITVCDKKPAYAPLKCSKELAATGQYPTKQCESKAKDGTTKILEGTLIKGCLTGAPKDPVYPDSSYPQADIDQFDRNDKKCAEDASQWGYKYVPEWAVVTTIGTGEGGRLIDLKEHEYGVKGTVAWPVTMAEQVPKEIIAKVYGVKDPANLTADEDIRVNGDGATAKPFYRTTYCNSWDRVIDKKTKEPGNPESQAVVEKGAFADFINGQTGNVGNIKEENCNTDNSSGDILGYKMATPFNPEKTFNCSIQERIVGKTGTDIFAKYVGALYKWAAGIVGIVAVFTMVYSGIQISIAGGGTIDEAKNRILMSLAGLALLFLSGLILYTINPGFFTG